MTTRPVQSLERRETRWLVAIFVGAWLIHFGLSLVGWENTLLNRFQFRQVQTAVSAAYYPPGQLKLDYDTPIFGPPWSVPLEFPAFQASVATFAAVTAMPLDPAGRCVSWLYFQLSLPAFFLLLGSFGVRPSLRLLGLALLLTSPIYLFFSRAFLIESCVLFFCAWFLVAFGRWLVSGKPGWLVVALVAGAFGATVKATTMVVFSVAALGFLIFCWQQVRAGRPGPSRRQLLLRTALAFSLPAVAGLAWVIYSARVRHLNPESAFLESVFGTWTFGDLPQRFTGRYWARTVHIWADGLATEAGLILGLYLLARPTTRYRALALAGFGVFLSAQLIFANLYEVHDYYFYANGVFLLLALGLLLGSVFEDRTIPLWGRVALPCAVIALQLAHYAQEYYPDQRRNDQPNEVMQAVEKLTRPDDLVIVFGYDWDVANTYYAGRRALMFRNDREADPAAIRATVERLDPRTVGAVLIFGGHRADLDYVTRTMSHLGLGSAPVLLSDPRQAGLWFPVGREAEARARLPLHPYPTLEVVPERPAAGRPVIVAFPEILRHREFDDVFPRPSLATSPNGISRSQIGTDWVLNAHSPSELVFRVRPGSRRLHGSYGILDAAYTGRDRTDGVEFTVAIRVNRQPEQEVFRRFLNPASVAADQGSQPLELELTVPPDAVVILRTLPGPAENRSYDWSYWGRIEIR